MKSPLSNGMYVLLWIVTAFFALGGACLLWLGILGNGDSFFLVVSALVIALPVLIMIFWVRPRRQITMGPHSIAEARILDRRAEKVKAGASGSLLDLPLLAVESKYPSYRYLIDIEYVPDDGPGSGEPIRLQVQVTEEAFDELVPGTTTKVQYSLEDPRVATIEGMAMRLGGW